MKPLVPYYRQGRGWYGDFRGLGGKREALKALGSKSATQDPDEALRLYTERREFYKDRLEGKTPKAPSPVPTLAAFVDRQCSVKDYRASSESRERMAFRAIYQFPAACGGEIPLDAITPEWCEDLRLWRADAVSKRTRQLEERALTWLLDQAVTRRLLVANPMRALDTLKVPRHRAAYLEPAEVVAILDAARALDADPHHCAFPFLEVVIAMFAYTGCRAREVWGLTPADIGDVIRIRPNPFNRLKRETSERVVRLWPELRAILEPHLALVDVMDSPTVLPWRGKSYPDVRKLLGRAVKAAKVTKPVTWHTFRHTYTAMRIQTLDHGAPISLFTVAAELGHTNTNLIRTTYGHLLTDRRRLEVVAYRGTETSPGTAADPVDVSR